MAAARCNARGEIVESNAAFGRMLGREVGSGSANGGGLRWLGLVDPEDRPKAESLLCELLEGKRESISIALKSEADGMPGTTWSAWRLPGTDGEPEEAALVAGFMVAAFKVAEFKNDQVPAESLIQAQKWEAVGRLAGGVVHDFNNLLTGVMLYCDLLLSSLDGRDRRRRYAEQIRSAITQASGLVQQLLVFARPQAARARTLCLNDTAEAMRDLLARLIGENIALELRLDPDLALVKIDQAQAEQVLLNLVLNARDALPGGGRITVETSNCRFQPVAGTELGRSGSVAFPCVLLVVADNGRGMDEKTRERLFEPFFTTKSSGKGTGLGLTTVRSIVTTNRGLIHLESEAGRGTRAMVLLPRALPGNSESDAGRDGEAVESARRSCGDRDSDSQNSGNHGSGTLDSGNLDSSNLDSGAQDSRSPSGNTFQEMKKETIL